MNLDIILKDDDLYYQWVDYIEDYDTDNINDCYISIYDDYYNAEMQEETILYDITVQDDYERYIDYLDYIQNEKKEDREVEKIFDDENDKKYNDDSIESYFDDIPSREEITEYFGKHSFDDVPYGFVYMVKNKESGRCYIGQTKTGISIFDGKLARYPNGWLKEHKHKKNVNDDIKYYGIYSFTTLKVVALAYSKDELDTLEAYWIKKTDSINNGYNIARPRFVSVKKMKSINKLKNKNKGKNK